MYQFDSLVCMDNY